MRRTNYLGLTLITVVCRSPARLQALVTVILQKTLEQRGQSLARMSKMRVREVKEIARTHAGSR